MTLTLTALLESVPPAAVALTHFGAPGGATAQPWAVTSRSGAVALARTVCVPFFSFAEAENEPVAPVFVEASFFEPSRITTDAPDAPTPAAEILPENAALPFVAAFAVNDLSLDHIAVQPERFARGLLLTVRLVVRSLVVVDALLLPPLNLPVVIDFLLDGKI